MPHDWRSYLGLRLAHPCPLCAMPFAKTTHAVCESCYKVLPWVGIDDQRLDILSAFYYDSPLDQLILTGKQTQRLDRLQLLAELITPYFLNQLQTRQKPQAILPVPLHINRLRQRGFNQALELTRHLAKSLNIPILKQAVSRQRHTREQKYLAANQRTTNLKDAFILNHPLPYTHIAIFDDVVTTGATTQILSHLLLKAGVKTVEIWSVAKTKQWHNVANPVAIEYDTSSIDED